MDTPEFVRPYSVTEDKGFWKYLSAYTWYVNFEETSIMGPMRHVDATRIAAALNGAYNLGRASIALYMEKESENQQSSSHPATLHS